MITSFAKDRHDQESGDLCLATLDSLAPDGMGLVLKHVLQKYPRVRPIHHAGPALLLIDKIRSGLIEFGMFFNVPELPPDLEKTKLPHVPFEFVIAAEGGLDKLSLASTSPKEFSAAIAIKKRCQYGLASTLLSQTVPI